MKSILDVLAQVICDIYVCSYPGCGQLKRLTIVADVGGHCASGIRLNACGRHERPMTAALKLLGYDAEVELCRISGSEGAPHGSGKPGTGASPS